MTDRLHVAEKLRDIGRALNLVAGRGYQARAYARGAVAIESLGDPHRMDLPSRWIRAAKKRDLRFVVSTDAHSTRGMGAIDFGISLARRGGLGPSRILNTLTADDFCRAVKP